MINLSAKADYGLSGQYIARLTGRHSGYTFNREFIGRKGGKRNETTEVDVDDPGLYECCDIDKRDGKSSRFYAVVEIGGTLHRFRLDKEEAMKIAKEMDGGRRFDTIVVGRPTNPPSYEILGKKAAEVQQKAQTLATAVEQCWTILQALPVAEAKKVLTQLKTRLTPTKPSAESPSEAQADPEA